MRGTCTVSPVASRNAPSAVRRFIERRLPGRLEVERVDQHQPGQRVEEAGRDDHRDLVPGLLGDPGVDGVGGGRTRVDEVDELQPGAVVVGQVSRKSLRPGHALLTEQGVGGIEHDLDCRRRRSCRRRRCPRCARSGH